MWRCSSRRCHREPMRRSGRPGLRSSRYCAGSAPGRSGNFLRCPRCDAGGAAEPDRPPHPLSRALWLLLPFGGSMLLLAVTNQLCQEVAVVPFLWVLPLGLYLLSFIFCFESDRWYRRWVFWPLAAIAMAAILGLMFKQIDGRVRGAGGDLQRRAVRALHGVPRGTGAAETGAEAADLLLPDGLGRRRAGRRVRGADRADDLQDVRRAEPGSLGMLRAGGSGGLA